MPNFYNEFKSKTILQEYGLPTGYFALATSLKQAVEIAEEYGYPLVMKIVSDQIIHKTEAKGIKLGISNSEEAAAAYNELIANAKAYNPNAVIDGVMLSPMVPSGVEVIVGGLRDVQFGPVIMFGLGGIFVEIFKDVQFRMAPLKKKEALALIKSIKAFPMLNGARGKEPVNLDALAELLVKTGDYLTENENVKEIDLNPVICFDNQVRVLDASIGIKSSLGRKIIQALQWECLHSEAKILSRLR
ncbi:acetate--CoA ligase family protein [Desulfitobacterium sp. AusDCA]|uniref:acetate--CoA ligase family protein n=1 Tax=Desulfitobacterium sp. AusDCA TaxID=3240383 RepID=UPI003DA771F8